MTTPHSLAPGTLTLRETVNILDTLYPPHTAEAWDAVGLIAGDPSTPIHKILFAVDPVATVVDEAIEWGANLVVTHHPLYLRGVHSVAATNFKGAVVHRLITAGIGLYAAHTNADAAPRGVADALADCIGLIDRKPLVARADTADIGIGRVGRLGEPTSLYALAQRVAAAVPATAQGVRIAGNLDAEVNTVAVVGGAGDSLFDAVRACGADVYITADLRHHPASELREQADFDETSGMSNSGKPFLIDLAHFASEWPWLRYAAHDVAQAIAQMLAQRGNPGTVSTRVSERSTDAWTARI
ncbi:MAG: Nif3-like dinuclear metal center hexameric protein [Cellulomonadaceae bacterium]|nr:Nif3-like dinuclear metal center hexameric protein [Cellulomonadaceae bacterium]